MSETEPNEEPDPSSDEATGDDGEDYGAKGGDDQGESETTPPHDLQVPEAD